MTSCFLAMWPLSITGKDQRLLISSISICDLLLSLKLTATLKDTKAKNCLALTDCRLKSHSVVQLCPTFTLCAFTGTFKADGERTV